MRTHSLSVRTHTMPVRECCGMNDARACAARARLEAWAFLITFVFT